MAHENKRSRKRARQAEASAEAKERFRYGLIAHQTLRAMKLEDLGLHVADAEVLPSLDGKPDGMAGWLIFADREEAKMAAMPDIASGVMSRLRKGLQANGFPKTAVPSFALRFTSQPEIEAAGGRFAYFRSI